MNLTKTLLSRVCITVVAMVSFSIPALAQISFGGQPASFGEEKGSFRSIELPTNVIRITPNFNVEDLRSQEQWNMQEVRTRPLMIGRFIDREIDFAKEAKEVVLDNGLKVYRLRVDLAGAKGIMFTYKDFFIPKGAGEFFIYTPDHQSVLGAYSYETHKEHGVFSTEPISGSSAILEYVPNLNGEMPNILISQVAYIYNDKIVLRGNEDMDPGEDRSLEQCQININCPQGTEWQTQKSGVCQIIIVSKRGVGVCSGDLINNTAQDFKPYIISAAHCATTSKYFTPTADELKKWIFSFHYEKPNCSNGQRALPNRKTMVGAQMRSFLPISGQSDGLLLELLEEIPNYYGVYYNGWDRTDKMIPRGVGIHHPAGDAKKISVLEEETQEATWNGVEKGYRNAHFTFIFTQGNTEGGSSGSSLFNQNKLVVGTLSGGGTSPSNPCLSTEYYGRLYYHWDKFAEVGKAYTQMKSFLDPGNTGVEVLEGTWRDNIKPLERVKDIRIVEENGNIKVTWSPVNTDNLPKAWKVKYRIYRNGRYLDEDVKDGTTFTEPKTKAFQNCLGNLVYGIQARYLYNGDVVTDKNYGDAAIVEAGLYVGKPIKKMKPKVSPNPLGDRKGNYIEWFAPKLLQEISLSGFPAKLELKKFTPIYISANIFGQGMPKTAPGYAVIASKFPSYYFQNFRKDGNTQYISAISFIPTPSVLDDFEKTKGDYKIYICNGGFIPNNKYSQSLVLPKGWKEGQWVTVQLDDPVAIDPNKSLYVGVQIKNRRDISNRLGIMQILNTQDDQMKSVDALVSCDGGTTFFTRSQWRMASEGYLALRVTLSMDVEKNDSEDKAFYAKGTQGVPFPEIKGYKLYRDGVLITGDDPIEWREFTDKEGKKDSKYEVEVIYGDQTYAVGNKQVRKEKSAYVFPSHIGFNGLLNINSSENVAKILIYTMDGKLVYQKERPASSISVKDLAKGSYIVVLDTTNGRVTEQIIR